MKILYWKKSVPCNVKALFLFTVGIWTHLVVVYNGGLGKVKIFVDGVKILTTTKGVVKQEHVPWSTPITVGIFTGNDAAFFSGAMDEFYIFTSALMHTEVEALKLKCEFPSDSKCTATLSPRLWQCTISGLTI